MSNWLEELRARGREQADYDYELRVCRPCPTYLCCEGSNLEDCRRRDKETDRKMAAKHSPKNDGGTG